MKIYIGHSRDWDYQKELYEPILSSNLNKEHEIILPHISEKTFNTKNIIEESDLFIAEVSLPSLGLGIEIGRSEAKQKRLLCIYNSKYACPESLKYVKTDVIEYKDQTDMINKIEGYIQKIISER